MLKVQLPLAVILLLIGSLSAAQSPAEDPWEAQLKKAWWNQTVRINELELSVEARARMDGHARDYLVAEAKLRAEREPLGKQLNAAMLEGDWALAQTLSERISAESSRKAVDHRAFKFKVLGELSKAQREALFENIPRLIGRRWVRLPAASLLQDGAEEGIDDPDES